MDFGLNEQQEMLRNNARNFLTKECPESLVREIERDSQGYSPELWRKMAELGWLGIPFPEEYGGTCGNVVDLVVLFEEMGRAMCPCPYLSTVVLCGMVILEAGNEEQKSEYLQRIADGDLILALALTEPSATIEPKGIQVQATADNDEFVINGTKLFVHDAHIAGQILCVARTKAGSNDDGISLFLVDSSAKGVTCEILQTTAGDKQCELVFNNVRIPKRNMVGELNKGWSPLSKIIQVGAVLLCAQMVGAGQKVLEMAVDYAKTRIQFDQFIGVNQHIQEHCINIFTRVNGSRFVTYKAAYKLSEDLPGDMEVAIAKAWTSEAHEFVCRSAHNVFGGAGYTYDSTLPLYTKRGKVAQLYLGEPAYYRKQIARQMDSWTLAEPKGTPLGLWDKLLA
ncbi:acyl-CoA dehydrogenase family protein [Chloroflexota bacterium]